MAKAIGLAYVKQLKNQPNWQISPYSNVMAVVSQQEKIIDRLMCSVQLAINCIETDKQEAKMLLESILESIPEDYLQKMKGTF